MSSRLDPLAHALVFLVCVAPPALAATPVTSPLVQVGTCATVPPASCGVGSTLVTLPASSVCFGGCPTRTASPDWNSEAPAPTAPRLSLPKLQPTPGFTDVLVQVDVDVSGRVIAILGLENRNATATCSATVTANVDLTASIVGHPASPAAFTFPVSLTQPLSLSPYDGTTDFLGPSGDTIDSGTTTSTQCRRFTGADTAFFVDSSPATTADDTFQIAHMAHSASSATGCAPVSFLSDLSGSIEIRVTYKVCRTPAPQAPFCFGDGTFTDHTTPCPCGNVGTAGNGCRHSANATGANLSATGTPAANDVVLRSQFEPATSFTLFLQHSATGDGVFHDGVLCAGGTLIRLRGRAAVGGQASFPNSLFAQDSTTTLAARGGVTPGSGVRRYYSAWFRNAASSFCPPATANITNGWRVDW